MIMDKRELFPFYFFLFLFLLFFLFFGGVGASCIYAPTGTIIPFGISSVLSFYGSQAFCVTSAVYDYYTLKTSSVY